MLQTSRKEMLQTLDGLHDETASEYENDVEDNQSWDESEVDLQIAAASE